MSGVSSSDTERQVLRIIEPSIQSLFVVPMVNNLNLGSGTGFIVRHENRSYLITNYHIAAGRNPRTGQPMHSSGAVPDKLRITYMRHPKPDRIEWEPRDEMVLETDPERALWLQHPVHGRKVDVVAVPLKNTGGVALQPYDLSGSAPKLMFAPSEAVSVIGFPFGISGGGAFGIWTRGFVASEPDIDWDDFPCFLIDARTRPGQSGSPVIIYSSGGAGHALAGGGLAFFQGSVTNLLGVYSGRINDQSDLGIVWKVQVVRDILAAQQPGVAGL